MQVPLCFEAGLPCFSPPPLFRPSAWRLQGPEFFVPTSREHDPARPQLGGLEIHAQLKSARDQPVLPAQWETFSQNLHPLFIPQNNFPPESQF